MSGECAKEHGDLKGCILPLGVIIFCYVPFNKRVIFVFPLRLWAIGFRVLVT